MLFLLFGLAMNTRAKVLILNEDGAGLLLCQQALAAAGFSVLTTQTRDQLFAILTQQMIDVVLLECCSAEEIKLIGSIKAQWPDTQVVVATDSPSLANAKRAMGLGAYDYLAKPVLLGDICVAVQLAAVQKKWALHRITGQILIPSIHCGESS